MKSEKAKSLSEYQVKKFCSYGCSVVCEQLFEEEYGKKLKAERKEVDDANS